MRRITNRARQKEYKEYDKFVKKAIREAAKNKAFCVNIDPELLSTTFISKLAKKHFTIEDEGCVYRIYW